MNLNDICIAILIIIILLLVASSWRVPASQPRKGKLTPNGETEQTGGRPKPAITFDDLKRM